MAEGPKTRMPARRKARKRALDVLYEADQRDLPPAQVLTATQRQRLAQAAASDRTVAIRSAAEIGDAVSRPTASGTQTWRFHMARTRDVAFAEGRAHVRGVDVVRASAIFKLMTRHG